MVPVSIPGFTDPVSSFSHLFMAGLSAAATPFLLYKGRGNAARVMALGVYSFSLMFCFSMSGVFHLLDRGGLAREVLQRLDHAGIWVLIAGTITPVQVILFRGPWRWGMLLLVWTLAIVGLVLEIVFFTEFPEWLLISFFLGLGWLGAFSMLKFRRVFTGASIALVVAGGLFYTFGAVLEYLQWPTVIEGVIGSHEIFHILVALGAISHWAFVYNWCHHPIGNEIFFHVHIFPDGRVHARAVGDSLDIYASSVTELKGVLMDHVMRKFHTSMRPLVRLRYFNDEVI